MFLSEGIDVVSLFDGMSCGRIALARRGIGVKNYYASEIDKYAMVVSKANWPRTQHMGDVTKWREWPIDWSKVKLVIAGSPCQGFSSTGKQGGTKAVLDGVEYVVADRETYISLRDQGAEFLSQSYLFWEFVLCLDHAMSCNPNVKFLLENVKMSKNNLDMITDALDVEPVFINSALVSAQNRQRYYWTNIGLADGTPTFSSWFSDTEKYGGTRKEYDELYPPHVPQPEDRGILLADIIDSEVNDINSDSWHEWWEGKKEYQLKKKFSVIVNDGSVDKAIAMTARQYPCWAGNFAIVQKARGNNPGGVRATDGKTPTMTSNSWQDNNHLVTSVKSGTRRSRGDEIRDDDKSNPLLATGHQSRWLSKDDFFYRKLTPVECERLQTVQDGYTDHVSNTQRYKMLGNGWTVDVIKHILDSSGLHS